MQYSLATGFAALKIAAAIGERRRSSTSVSLWRVRATIGQLFRTPTCAAASSIARGTHRGDGEAHGALLVQNSKRTPN